LEFGIWNLEFNNMANIEKFEDLEVFQAALKSADLIYDATSLGRFSQDYVLRDQIRRAGVSIFSNIAEGFERDGNKEFSNFLSIAKGSCGEARSQILFAFKRKYLSEIEFKYLTENLVLTSKQLSAFASYLRKSDLKGRKFT
jgi:four helix bundle protein